jgi:hypothetical protein
MPKEEKNVEGHVVSKDDQTGDDVEGHRRKFHEDLTGDDVEGHRWREDQTGDDVEGHGRRAP